MRAVRNSLPRTLPSNAWFALPPVHTSDAPHGQSFGRRPGVVVLNLELSASTANVLQTPACSHVLLTQEELLAEPGSGSEGSSTVESILTTSMRSATALLVTMLTDGLENVLGSAAKAGAAPTIMTIGTDPPRVSPSHRVSQF